jgi:hypothetical protein
VEDINVLPMCQSLAMKNFNFVVFTMETDDPSFDKFLESFDEGEEEDVPKFLDVQYNWRRRRQPSNIFLQPFETGVLIIAFDISQFIFALMHSITVHLSFTIKDEMESVSRLMYDIADFALPSNSIHSTELSVIEWKEQIFRNVLALTSVSEEISIRIFLRDNIQNFMEFLVDQLNMEIVNESSLAEIDHYSYSNIQFNSNTNRQYFLHCSQGFFNGVSIRFKPARLQRLRAKIYAR